MLKSCPPKNDLWKQGLGISNQITIRVYWTRVGSSSELFVKHWIPNPNSPTSLGKQLLHHLAASLLLEGRLWGTMNTWGRGTIPKAEGLSKSKHIDLRLATSFSLLSSGTEVNIILCSREKEALSLRKDMQVLILAILPSINGQDTIVQCCAGSKSLTHSIFSQPIRNNSWIIEDFWTQITGYNMKERDQNKQK